MKKQYVTPMMVGERFLPNEYVAACGDSGTVYKFACNAGDSGSKYNVYYEDGTENQYTKGRGYYHPCGDTHQAESESGFYNGYMYKIEYDRWGQEKEIGDKIPVIIWTEGGRDVHCTTNLDMSKWETAKS